MAALDMEMLSAAPAPVTGAVFEDGNGNGSRDVDEPGVPDVVLRAIDQNGVATTATTAPDGSYSFDLADDATSVRVELTTAPIGLEPASLGADTSGSTVAFVAPGQTADFALHRPTLACETEKLAVACFMFGDPDAPGEAANLPALITMPADSTGYFGEIPGEETVVTFGQIGAIYGLTPDPSDPASLYASSYVKRHSGLKDTPGTIWHVTPGLEPQVFARLPAGADPHVGTTDWLVDGDAWDAVGKSGLGDMDLSADKTSLFVVNLADRRLWNVPLANPDAATSTPIPVPQDCPADDWRPMGLGISPGNIYVGGVCSKQSDGIADAAFRATVYRADPTGTFDATAALSFRLDYDRKCATSTSVDGNLDGEENLNDPDNVCNESTDPTKTARFAPWAPATVPANFDDSNVDDDAYQNGPMLSDVTILSDGSMIVGFRGRFGDQTGSPTYAPGDVDGTGPLYEGIGMGDNLRACLVGGVFTLESNGACGELTGSGVGNREGPGGGEFFGDDDTYWHDQTYMGAAIELVSTGEVVFTAIDPEPGFLDTFDLGINFVYSVDGGYSDREVVLFNDVSLQNGSPPDQSLFGKTNGLGDLELLCDRSPVEIGNRIWLDTNADGVQDPDEAPLADVEVNAMEADGAQTLTTTTDARGRYVFRGLKPSTAYKISVPDAVGASQQAAIAGMQLTVSDTDGAGMDCLGLADNDAVLSPDGVTAQILVTSGEPGGNNHSCDFGFTPDTALACLGDIVIEDRDADGIQDRGEPGVAGVTVQLTDGSGNDVGRSTTTATDGTYAFCGLVPGAHGVRFVAPTGFDLSRSNRGSDEGVDCDADPQSGIATAVTLVAGDFNRTLDACIHRPPTVGGTSVTTPVALPRTGVRGSDPVRPFSLALFLGECGGILLIAAKVIDRRAARRDNLGLT